MDFSFSNNAEYTVFVQVINGAVLPPNDIIQPSHSFDGDDRLLSISLPKDMPATPQTDRPGPSVKESVSAPTVLETEQTGPPKMLPFSNEVIHCYKCY